MAYKDLKYWAAFAAIYLSLNALWVGALSSIPRDEVARDDCSAGCLHRKDTRNSEGGLAKQIEPKGK